MSRNELCASNAQGRVRMPADKTAMAATRRYGIERITNVSIMQAGESRKWARCAAFSFRMAFLVWSRKDGSSSPSDLEVAPAT